MKYQCFLYNTTYKLSTCEVKLIKNTFIKLKSHALTFRRQDENNILYNIIMLLI